MTTSYYAAPQVPGEARRLFDAACRSFGLDDPPPTPLRPSRAFASALILAREWQLDDLEQRLSGAIEASYEPTWDDQRGEFTWGMGLDEPHPRGQFNAFLAAAEASGRGMWERLSAVPLEPCPQVVGVDFQPLLFTGPSGLARTSTSACPRFTPDPNKKTSFRIVGAEPRLWDLSGIDGASMESTASALVVTVPLVEANLEFTAGSY